MVPGNSGRRFGRKDGSGDPPRPVPIRPTGSGQATPASLRPSDSGSSQRAPSVAMVAAERVRSIVEVSERTRTQIRTTAEREARSLLDEARREAARMRIEAETEAWSFRDQVARDAAAQIAQVCVTVAGIRDRATAAERDAGEIVGTLVHRLQDTVRTAECLRSSAGLLESELEDLAGRVDGWRSRAPVVERAPREAPAGQAALAESSHVPAKTATPSAGERRSAGHERSRAGRAGGTSAEGARLVALNMFLQGAPPEETARYLEENFDIDPTPILDLMHGESHE